MKENQSGQLPRRAYRRERSRLLQALLDGDTGAARADDTASACAEDAAGPPQKRLPAWPRSSRGRIEASVRSLRRFPRVSAALVLVLFGAFVAVLSFGR